MTLSQSIQVIDRWHQRTFAEQMGNIGSEVGRVFSAKKSGNAPMMEAALVRALDLFDRTKSDPKNRGRLKEICRSREVFCDFAVGNNEYDSTEKWLDDYFMDFALLARKNR